MSKNKKLISSFEEDGEVSSGNQTASKIPPKLLKPVSSTYSK